MQSGNTRRAKRIITEQPSAVLKVLPEHKANRRLFMTIDTLMGEAPLDSTNFCSHVCVSFLWIDVSGLYYETKIDGALVCT